MTENSIHILLKRKQTGSERNRPREKGT